MAKYTVKKALEDRKDRMKEEEYNARYQAALQAPEWYANRNKPLSVKEALNERKKRIDKDSSSIKNDIASRYNSVVNAFNDYAQTSPRFGEKAGEDTASIQKNNRQNIRSLVSDIKGYKSVIGEKEADKMLKALESMQGVYDSAYQAASKIYSNFDSKEDYQDFMNPTSDVIPVGNKALPSKDKNKVGGVYSFDSGMKNSAFDNLAFSGNKETLPADGVNDEDRLSMYIYFQQKAREARANGASKEDVNAFLAQAEKARTKEGYQELASGWLLYDNATDEETVNARKAIYERKLAELQRLESRIAYTPDGAEKDELVNQKEKVQSEVDAYDSIQKNKEMLVFDIEAGQKEVDSLQSASDEISSLENKKSRNSVSDIENALRRQGGYSEHDLKEKASAIAREQAQRNKDIDANISEILNKSGYNTVDELRRAVAEKRAYILQAKNLQRINEFSANARNSSDFEKYSSIGAAIENPSFEDAEKGLAIGTWRPFGETVNNPVTYSRENAVAIALENKEGHPAVGDFRYRSMTNEEVEVYNYYLAKEQAGQVAEGTAQSYLDSLDDILNQREAQDFAEAMKGNTALELAFGIAAGIDQFASGIKNLVQSGDEYIAPSMKQYISGEVREDLADSGATVFGKSLGQWGYDAVTTTANMLPSIAASYIIGQINPVVGEWVGSGLMGASAAGNEYASMINEGYSKGQARVASTLTGASEALLQKMLGGLPGLNGVLTDKAIEAFASGLKSAGAKLAVSLAGKVYAEGMEEFLQEVLSPYIKAFATGTTPEDVDWEEAIYSGILGAMTSLVFGGADTISNGVSLAKYNRETYAVKGAKIINSEDVRVLARYAEAAMSYGETYSDIDVKGISKYLGKVEKAIDRTGYYTNSDMVNIGKLYDLVSNAAATIISSPEVNIDSDGVSRAAQYAQEAVRQLTAPDTEQTTVPNTNPPTVQTAEQEAYVQEDKAKEPSSVEVPAQETEEITDNEAVQPQTDSVQTEAINAAERSERSAEALKFALDDIDDTNISKAAVDLIASEYDGVIPATEYVQGMQEGFKFGYSGIPESGLADYKGAFGQLSEMQKKHSYNLGVLAAKDKATARDSEVKGKIKTALENSTGENKDITVGRKKGVVQGKGVSLEDLKKTFNDTQNKAYKILSTVSEATGIDIVLYKSEADANGKFTGPQGKFKWSNDKIYIDLNAGLLDEMDVSDLGAYALLRTFCHENVHFIEKWNELGYNDLRNLVFEELQNRGEDVDSLVREYAEKLGLDYDKASREVVAQSLTDILPDSNFVKKILDKNESLFRKILDKLKEFLEEVKAYFRSLGKNGARVADVLKEEINGELHYLQNIVDLFDKVAVQAVENYQMTFAVNGISEDTGSVAVAEESKPAVAEKKAPAKSESSGNIQTAETKKNTPDFEKTAKIAEKIIKATPKDLGTIGMSNGKDIFLLGNMQCVVVVDENTFNSAEVSKAKSRDAKPEKLFEFGQNKKIEGSAYSVLSENGKTKLVYIEDGKDGVLLKLKYAEAFDGYDFFYNPKDEEAPVIVKDANGATVGLISQRRKPLEGINTDGLETLDMKSFSKSEKGSSADAPKKIVFAQKKDFAAADIEYHIPGYKKPIAYSTKATADHLESIAEDNPTATISQIRKTELYDEEAYKVLDAYISNGLGNKTVGEMFTHDKDHIIHREETTDEKNGGQKGSGKALRKDNGRTVRPSSGAGEGTSRLLDEVQAEDVQRTGGQGNASETPEQRGGQADRLGDRTDETFGSRGSDGSREVGDLRRDDVVNETEKKTKDESLKKVVDEQIEQKSTQSPKGNNFVISDSLSLPQGEKARFRANLDAIKLVKKLESENRFATPAEQEVLSKYVGWGGLSNAFGEGYWNYDTHKTEIRAKKGWEKEFDEFKQLVTDGIISEDEYKAASASTKNAHYTSVEVIKAMYDGLEQLGFNGGRMLEPSAGVGNFIGAMPSALSSKVNSWTAVELDSITGHIAKYLYPNADVRIQGFEAANLPDNYMDVAIGNVPFGNYGITDSAYPKRVTKAIHNYFFAKALDKVRPGGIVMFITSSFTMNGKDTAIRQYIMDRADLLGAIRLPNNAFSENAGTQVVTDILVLKKREKGTPYAGEDFLNTTYQRFKSERNNADEAEINKYFANHPEMVLGTPARVRGMYGDNSLTYNPFTDRGALGEQIRNAFKTIQGKMAYPKRISADAANFRTQRADKKPKQGGFVANADGTISRYKEGKLEKYDTDKANVKRITGLLEVRDAYKTLINYIQQGQAKNLVAKARKDLNAAYDKFVKENGYINSPKNKAAIKDDPDSFSIYSLENYDAKTKKATKADIFEKDTIKPNRTINHVEDVSEGVIVSVNTVGGIDTELISKLTGKSEKEVSRELIDSRMAFKTKDGQLETPERYLSGNVRAKLREAEALVPFDNDFQNNVEELKKVVPKDIPYNDIYVALGTPWIPASVYADFIANMLGSMNISSEYRVADVEVERSNVTGSFSIRVNNNRLKKTSQNIQRWGTSRKTFLQIVEALMSSRSITVKDTVENEDGRKTSVVNKVETAAAQEKAEEVAKKFQEWLWQDETRKKELSELYNNTFNAIVTPKYDGSHLAVNGLNAEFSLREHQANAVQRIIASGGNTLLAHKVGAGKTLEMASAAMKLKELGIIKKPMFVVPKSLVAQWGVEFKKFFPAARILVSDEKDFTPANRKTFSNKISNGDFDAVIVSYEQFEKVPLSAEYQKKLYEQQKQEAVDAIAEARAENGGRSLSIKELEKILSRIEAKIELLTRKEKDEANVDFEQLGVDSLFVDEAHNFKNLFYTTNMSNISGLGNSDGSQRSFDLYSKVRYLQGMNGGRGIVFATATPVMNSMAEMYIMQKYLQSDMLKQLGLLSFDDWAKQFGEVVNSVEIKPSGQGFRVKQSFSNFKNLNELQLLFRSFSDVLTHVDGLKIPKMKGGKVKTIVCEPGEFQKNYMKELEERAENVKSVNPKEDNMLKITSDGRKVAYTQRMIDPSLPYEAGCKVFKCCENVIEEYKSSSDIKGTQIVFCDMATPKGADKKKAQQSEDSDIDNTELDTGSAKLYDDMKSYLAKNGIPASEIAFIHDAKTDAAKKQLFEDVNNGTVRVLIGSTGKMGVGMNAQKRIVAIHHLDAPWRPGDVEQRDGRAFRQGNINDEVSKYTYVTKGSFDARLWDILDRKQHFINQIMEGENVGRTAEDTGDVTLSAAEVKALASGNPLIMEQVQLSNELQKLENLQKAHRSSVLKAQSKVLEDGQKIVQAEKTIERISADIETRVDTYSEGNFSMTVDGKTYTDKKEAGVALLSSITLKASTDKYAPVGKFAGFTLYAAKDGVEYSGIIKGQSSYKFNVYMSNTTQMINKICATVADLETRLKAWKDELARTETDLAAQEEMAAEPFAKQEELDKKLARFNEVMKILNPQDEQQIADGEDEQYQSRKLLEDDEESFPTIGVHWGIADGILTKTDARAVWEAIANIQNRGFRGYPKTVTGEHYIESGNKLMIVDTNFRHPRVETIFVFNDTSETNMSEAKELLIDAEGVYERLQNAWEAIRDVQGDEYVSRYDCEDSPSYARKNPGREGTNRGADNSGIDEQQQERTETLTDRRVLEIAASELDTSDLTEGEIFALNTFKKRLENIRDLQAQRKEQGSLYKEQQFGSKSDRSEAVKTLNRMNILDEQIRRESAELLSVEEKEVLKRVLQRSRKVIEKKDREETKQLLRRQSEKRKEAEAVRKYRQRIKLDVSDISSWITNPNNKTSVNRVPDILKNSVIPFLTSIDLTSKRQLRGGAATRADREFADRLEKMQEALKTNGEVNGLYSGYNDLPPDFTEHLQSFVNAVHILTQGENDSYVINRMTGEQLKDLSKIVRTLKKFIKEMNMFHYNAVFSHVSDAAENTISSLREINNAGNSENGVSNFIFWKNIRPAYAFERFGEGGKAIYDEFRRAQSTLAFHAKEIIDFAEKAYTTEEVKAWRKDYKEFNLDGDTVKMPVSYIMGLYELSKQPDSLRHILGDGIRIARHTFGKEKIQDVGHRLSESDVQEIIGVLTERQKEVADALQSFMATQGAAWGNYVSVKRFGERLFTNPQYYPISSDGRYLESSADEQPQAASLYALLNMSFTKKRNENADNRIVIFDIFDVFANHMASMAQYNAFALPILDALKWFNYKQVLIDETTGAKEVIGSVRDEMNRVYGGGNETRGTTGGYAENFVKNIIKAYNGTESQGNPDDSLGLKALRAYNVAQIAFNGRVVIQQPVAIFRAGTVINYSDIIKGLKLKPSSIKANIDEMYKYSGIALWKSLGFYDINISRGLTDIIKHDSSLYDKAIEVGLKGAEKADEITWSAMWSACKEAVKKKQPYLNVGSPEFFETVAKLFEEVIYKTQVVDSVLTKSEFIRGKGFFARATSSFMSEPVTTASMVTDAYFSFKTDRRKGMSFNQAWRKHGKKIGRLTYVYVLGAFALAALVSFMDAAGDDDDESYGKKYLDAFVGNFIEELIPFNKLPVVSDAYDIVKSTLSAVGVDTYGNPPQTVFAQWYDSLMKGVEIVADKVSGESTGYTWYGGVSKLLQAVSGMTGLPLAAATREVVTVWNNTVGAINSDLKVRKYAGSNNASNAEDYLSLIAEGNKKESTELYNQWVEERKEQIAENREKDGKVPLSDTELEKEARSGVKSSISAQLRPKYIEAYRNGDNETMASIRKQMFATGLYVEAGKNPADVVLKTCNNWIEDYIQN